MAQRERMLLLREHWPVLALAVLLLLLGPRVAYCRTVPKKGNALKTATFLSPMFVLGCGSVENKYYYGIDFPTGHIAVKSFDAEVVDEAGNPIPLHETYLHHWVVGRYYRGKDAPSSHDRKQPISARNDGICQRNVLGQYFGLGSETRKTATYVPDPFGIEVGNPTDIPEGYVENWMLNVHAIDTRGVEDTLGCTECRCDLYNVTVDEYGRPVREDYKGGLLCCYDQTQCKLKEGFQSTRRNLYLKYTVSWLDWDDSIIPVKIYILDVTDSGKQLTKSTDFGEEHDCRVEYDVATCDKSSKSNKLCIDVKRTSLTMPTGGYVIYGVAHQHSGGIGSRLYGEDGRVICSSIPSYGKGKEAGNEAGYIVGMSTCYPQPGSVRISSGETLVLESNYSSRKYHTGVMGLFYLLVAEHLPESMLLLRNPVQIQEGASLPMPRRYR